MLNNYLGLLQHVIKEAFKKVGISPEHDKNVCPGCKNSKVIIEKDGKSYHYSYDKDGKQTLQIIENEHKF